MLIAKQDVVSEGTVLQSFKFRVEDEGSVIGFLRNSMYSNPIESICREIASNCRDAHRELGNEDRPIEITLPTAFAPEIRFRDFGVGITTQRMQEVYTSYGVSTKRDSNNQTGGFGLGAKSPFAYKPSFTISTVVPENGGNVKRIFSASVGEDIKGGVHLLAENSTSDERGTEVSIVVDKNDFNAFRSGLIKATKYWKVKPIFKGADESFKNGLEIDEEVLLSGEGWEIIKADYYSKRRRVIVDGIPYPLNLETVFAKHPELLKIVERTSLNLFFNTGELELSAPRENLNYTFKTIKIILDRFISIVSELETILQKQINDCKTYVDALQLVLDFGSETGFYLSGDLTWKNSKVFTNRHDTSLYIKDLENLRLDQFVKKSSNANGFRKSRKTNIIFSKEYTYIINRKSSPISVDDMQNLISKHNTCYVLTARDKNITGLLKEIKDTYGFDFEDLDPKDLSSFKVPRVAAKKRVRTNCFSYTGTGWEAVSVDIKNDSGYYIIMSDRKQIMQLEPNGTNFKSYFYSLNRKLRSAIGQSKLIGIKLKDIPALGTGFKPLKDLIIEEYKKINVQQLRDNGAYLIAERNIDWTTKTKADDVKQFLLYNNPLHEIIIEYNKKQKAISEHSDIEGEYKYFCQVLNVPEDLGDIKADMKYYNLVSEFLKKYPLLEFVTLNNKKSSASVLSYIKQIDEKE